MSKFLRCLRAVYRDGNLPALRHTPVLGFWYCAVVDVVIGQ
jgi:hypothetical protein